MTEKTDRSTRHSLASSHTEQPPRRRAAERRKPRFGPYSLPLIDHVLDEGGRSRWLQSMPLASRLDFLRRAGATQEERNAVASLWDGWRGVAYWDRAEGGAS